jgi:protein-S-isoprenylcysteine O-methyltransferase Ste14
MTWLHRPVAQTMAGMQQLELKIPPPVVALVLALVMGLALFFGPRPSVASAFRLPAAFIIALMGIGFSFAGLVAFRKAHTTVNPLQPEKASALVTSGVYRITRNPMYVGLLMLLLAWATFLSAIWSLAGPLVFYGYMNRFQIEPEERVLNKLFGEAFQAYTSQVRRWL